MASASTALDVQGCISEHRIAEGLHAAPRDERIAEVIAGCPMLDLRSAVLSNRVFSRDVQLLAVPQQSLEETLEAHICVSVDIRNRNDRHYLSPNENCTGHIKRHVSRMGVGFIVSTGTQRSFFDLLLSPEETCTGLVIRDTDPRVKAYVDLLILLLRISETMEEFNALSEYIPPRIVENADQRMAERAALIRSKIDTNNEISPMMKRHYLFHLRDFMEMYYPQSHFPLHYFDPRENDAVAYTKNPELFAKLQRYAREGNIVATVGSIDDLDFLDQSKIGFIDTSNIWQFTILKINLPEDCHPRVMWTMTGIEIPTMHLSYIHHNTPDEDSEEKKDERLVEVSEDHLVYQQDLNMLEEDSPLLNAPSVTYRAMQLAHSQED